MRYKINYKEGTWFGVPLRNGGYGVGVVARAKKACILGYFFGPRREFVPTIKDLSLLKSESALLLIRFGDLGLVNGDWPIIGELATWKRENWPMPVFIRREPISCRNCLVFYSDADPSKRIKETEEPNERPDLQEDSLYGYGAVELTLTKLLS